MMNLSKLEAFAVDARRELMRCVKDKIAYALQENSPVRRQNPQAVSDLEKALKNEGETAVIERTAYAWFNRFCALRFMDVNGYTDSGVVTPPMGGTIPGILAEARDGNFDEGLFASGIKERVRNILSGSTREDDPNSAAYRVLFIATCNSWQPKMPFLFERLGDWTEILLPDDLLSANSILAKVRNALTDEACADVTVIGWLYQFYISEKKNTVLDRLSRKAKVVDEDIPAATALFTPHWIVQYMVENSLGRWWMRLHPESPLKDQMPYYIPDDSDATPVPMLSDVEDITQLRVGDTSCGSGHILLYAFDLLYAMYEELGYAPSDIPGNILKYNLYGLEIDERSAALASFALVMKARSRYSRFLRNPELPHIVCLKNVDFSTEDVASRVYAQVSSMVGTEVVALAHDIHLFRSAAAYGSLLRPELSHAATIAMREKVRVIKEGGSVGLLFEQSALDKLDVLTSQLVALTERYHITVSNPPYLGSGGMNAVMAIWIKENYPDVKSDLFSAFIVRNMELTVEGGFLGFMSPFVWMFISSYEKLRMILIDTKTITSLVQLEYSGFAGATVPICTFTLENRHRKDYKGGYVRLSDFKGAANQGPKALEIIQAEKVRMRNASTSQEVA